MTQNQKKETFKNNEDFQKALTEFNFLHSPGEFNNMIRDSKKGREKKKESLTILEAFEKQEELKKEMEDDSIN